MAFSNKNKPETVPQDRGHDLDQRKIMIQEQPLSVVKEKTPSLPRTGKRLHVQEKHKFEHPFGQPYLDPSCLLKQKASDEHVIQYKSSENMAHNNDELVKNMLNLPGFLQRVEKKKNIQEKALNFGVLDWESLEKWKFNERMPGKYIGKTSLPNSISSSTPEGPPKISPNLRKQPSSHDLHLCSSPGKPPISHGKMLSSLSQSKPPALNSLHLNEGKKHVAALAHGKINAHEQKNEPRAGEPNLTFESFLSELQDVKLQKPEHCPCRQRSCLEISQCTESRTSFDEQISKEIGSRLSACFSPRECHSGELSARISHLFPQSTVATVPTEFATIAPSVGKCSALKEKTTRHSFSVEGSEKTQPDVSKDPTFKGRHLSPIHRFSFNLGRTSRSLSFKEGLAVAQMNPVHTAAKSETANPEITSAVNNFDRDTANSRTKGRSSPLRRLLDPLLKHKGAQSKTVSVQSISGDMATKGLSRDKKPGTSTLKALFHLTLKNELPFFNFVVENRIDKLAAVMHRHPQSGKSDNCKVFAFYSLHEIRKKGMNWMSQGSKATDSSGLGYSIVGQMKISSSCTTENSGQCVVRECVLYGIDPLEIIEQTHEFLPNKEIAAIVVKNSVEKLNEKELSLANGFHNGNTQENEISKSTVVILPSGVHGTPIKGAPSPLISRWRSCGACDCGGWDIGCKLRVLTSHRDHCCKIMKQSISKSSTDLVNFFAQEGQQKNKPVLTLEPVGNGFYSVAFDVSISLLEVFATCVASATCCKFYKILDANERSDTEFTPELNTGTAEMKSSTFQEPRPAEYSTCPPLSPVGRI
ncbi:uncharacterized protein [Primulina huaijiensis]|uniref:uncharacterized protein n=1 Tax=Primulina huaijiensis TaxID=1492673 RepID=UPI003CC76DAC